MTPSRWNARRFTVLVLWCVSAQPIVTHEGAAALAGRQISGLPRYDPPPSAILGTRWRADDIEVPRGGEPFVIFLVANTSDFDGLATVEITTVSHISRSKTFSIQAHTRLPISLGAEFVEMAGQKVTVSVSSKQLTRGTATLTVSWAVGFGDEWRTGPVHSAKCIAECTTR